MILYYFDDRDIAATAQILGIPSGTVKSRLDKARKLLKEALACQKLARRQIDHTYKQRAAGQDKQQSQENYGRTIRSDTILPFLQYG